MQSKGTESTFRDNTNFRHPQLVRISNYAALNSNPHEFIDREFKRFLCGFETKEAGFPFLETTNFENDNCSPWVYPESWMQTFKRPIKCLCCYIE
jgi:hypothetical protein